MVFVLLNKNQILHRKQKKKNDGCEYIYFSVCIYLIRETQEREGEKTDDDICDVILAFFHLILTLYGYNIYIIKIILIVFERTHIRNILHTPPKSFLLTRRVQRF